MWKILDGWRDRERDSFFVKLGKLIAHAAALKCLYDRQTENYKKTRQNAS